MIERTIFITSTVALVMLAAAAAGCSGGSDGVARPTASASAPATSDTNTGADIQVTYAPAGAAKFPVLAGSLRGNIDVEMFMPADIRIRVGDSIAWTALGIEGHTITFGDGDDTLYGIGDYLLPDPDDPAQKIFNPKLALPSEKQGTHDGDTTFINSGFIGVPVEAKYSLTFTKPGLFTYLCLVHPFTMTGTVSVEAAETQVESPETVRARGEAEAKRFTAELDHEAQGLSDEARTATGPDGATIHYVTVGAITDHGQVAVYTPGLLEIAAGDTVIFQNDDRNFHNVIFKGNRPELPPGVGLKLPADGRGLNFSLDNASAIAVDPPPEGFDDKTFLSSGSLGVLQPRLNWTLTFDKPGTYTYACTIHTLGGMVGAIEVR